MSKAPARAKANPSQEVFSSQSLRRHLKALEMVVSTVGPGTRYRQTKAMISAGMGKLTMKTTAVETFSFLTYG